MDEYFYEWNKSNIEWFECVFVKYVFEKDREWWRVETFAWSYKYPDDVDLVSCVFYAVEYRLKRMNEKEEVYNVYLYETPSGKIAMEVQIIEYYNNFPIDID